MEKSKVVETKKNEVETEAAASLKGIIQKQHEKKEQKAQEVSSTHSKSPEETIEEISRMENIKISSIQCIDSKPTNGRYEIVVTSKKIPGLSREYTFESIKNVAPDFMKEGHKLNTKNMSNILDAMTDNIQKYTVGHFHNQIGWDTYNNQPVFKYSQLASCQNIYSEYKGNLTIAPAGNIQDYIAGLKELAVPYPKLMLVYIAGASGMIKQALNIADTNIMVNIYGDSSSGKTTASDLAFSFWGKFSSIGFNTINRTEQMLVNRFIIPTAVDDLLGINICSSNREQMKTIIDQVFRYSAGKGKGRMNQDGAEYHGAVISSSETSLFKKIMGAEADGQFYRLIEMHIRRGELTTDANHAKQINNLIRKNYGLGAPKLGRYMVQNGYTGEKLMDLYEEQCNVIANDPRLSKYARIANRLGIIMVTCDLIDKCFGLGINKADIQEILIACVTQSFTVMKKKVASHQDIYEMIQNNPELFASNRKAFDSSKHIGVYQKNAYGQNTLIIPTDRIGPLLSNVPLAQILSGKGDIVVQPFTSREIRSILNNWRNQGWLECTTRNDQIYRKLTIGSSKKQSLVYVIVFN